MAIYINSIEDLDAIRNNLSEEYILQRDLDFNDDASYDTPSNKTAYTTGSGWLPIGDATTPFTGILTGQQYTIKNLYINRPAESVGLFGRMDGGEVYQLILENPVITGYQAAAFAHYMIGEAAVEFCGLINANITGSDSAGGIARTANGSYVGFCVIIGGTISGSRVIGSACAYLGNTGGIGYVYDIYSTANIVQTSPDTGLFRACGGIVGEAFGSSVSYCLFYGMINAIAGVDTGGIVGVANYCEIVINLAAAAQQNTGNGVIGVANNLSGFSPNWWDAEISQIYYDAYSFQLNTAQAKDITTYSSEWVSIATYDNHTTEYWKIDDDISYPILGFMPEPDPGEDISGTVSLQNIGQTIAVTAVQEAVFASVGINNQPQSVNSNAVLLVWAASAITNDLQTILGQIEAGIAAELALTNASQGLAAALAAFVQGSAALQNQNSIELEAQITVTLSGALENSPQQISITSVPFSSVVAALQNAPQTFEADVSIVATLSGALTNESQQIQTVLAAVVGAVAALQNQNSIALEVNLPIAVSAVLQNSPQIVSSSSALEQNASAALENTQQVLQIEMHLQQGAISQLENAPQTMRINAEAIVSVSASMENQNSIYAYVHVVDPHCDTCLINGNQELLVQGQVLITGQVGMMNDRQEAIISVESSIGMNLYVGIRKVLVIYINNKAISQLEFIH